MLRSTWLIARMDLQFVLHTRLTLLWLFVMPIIFFYFIGTVTKDFGGGTIAQGEQLALRVEDGAGFLADQIAVRLQEGGYRIVRPQTAESFAEQPRRMVIPRGFTDKVVNGEKVVLRLQRKEAGPEQDYDKVRLARAVYTTLADLISTLEAGEEPSPEAFRRLKEAPRSVTLDVQPAGKRRLIPTGFEQAIPGIMVMFTLTVLLTSGAITLVVERRKGLLRRLASTPIPRGAILLGKWTGKMALACVQITFAMIAGTVIFSMRWGPALPMILLVMLGWAALCASLGLLLGNLARTEGQASAIGVLAGMVLAAVGGCWWPIEITPRWMQTLAACLPTGWAMGALHKLISFQAGWTSALPHVIAMLTAALVLGWLGARLLRFE